jgi:hypothetical protein
VEWETLKEKKRSHCSRQQKTINLFRESAYSKPMTIYHINNQRIVHFIALLTKEDQAQGLDILGEYDLICQRYKGKGGRKYHNKAFGGGIAFPGKTEQELKTLIKSVKATYQLPKLPKPLL